MASREAKLSFKYIVIGNTSVGKSCLMLQFIDKRFQPVHDLTIGIEYGQRNVTVKGRSVNLQIYDTAGQENFRSIIRAYYRGAAGGLLVFDITKRKSFSQIEDWLSEVKRSANPNIVLVLVGNKADIASQRTVSEEEAQALAKKHGLIYVEASAKTGHNVDKAFERVAEGIVDKIASGLLSDEEMAGITKTGGGRGGGSTRLNNGPGRTAKAKSSSSSGCC